jgi:hypothetical protein
MRACRLAGACGAVPLGHRVQGFALRLDRWLVEALVAALLAFLAITAISTWRATDDKNSGFPAALADAVVSPPAGGYLTLTPAVLNRSQPTAQELNIPVRYVGADQVSSGPFVLSVHPIDASTWAAVARGPDGRCYGMLVSSHSSQIFYATFPAGTSCQGEIATVRTVTGTEFPEQP